MLIDARDDNEALAIAVTVDHLTTGSHVVVALRNMEKAALLRLVNTNIRCVQWHTPRMLTEEPTSPGITEVYAELMTHGGANTYSIQLPPSLGSVRAGHCQTALGQRHDATLLAVRCGEQLLVNPSRRAELLAGSTLYYIAPRRLTPEQLRDTLRDRLDPE